MSLQAFSFPFPETRFIRAACLIYKFKIRAGSSCSGKETMGGDFSQELEDIIRTVLGNLDRLQPFSSPRFNVFPYKKHWEGMSKVLCQHGERKLGAYPFILILYLEKNTQNEKQAKESAEKEDSPHGCESAPQSKRRRRDSPLEDATVKDLTEDMEGESKVSVVSQLFMDSPHVEMEVKEGPGYADKKAAKGFSDCRVVVPGSGTTWDEGVEQEEGEEGEEGESAGLVPGTPVRSGILSQIASHIFPFSWFFRDP